ncbi:hypothetical protein [Paenibacillus sedimenti]|nr:hypothetical protein [Paenibacillus sedimenti]
MDFVKIKNFEVIMTKRKLFYSIIALLILGSGLLLYKVENIVPSIMKFTDFGGANEFYFYENNIYYKNHELIQKYFDINKDKIVKKVPNEKAHIESKIILSFAYNTDKGRDTYIDDKGKIFFIVSKSEIRNKSRLHWLWWKLDFDKNNYIYYSTEADIAIVKLVNQIKNETRSSK